MTNKTLLLPILALIAGCHLDGSLKYDCKTNADCDHGNVCDNGVCIASSAAGPSGTGAITPTIGALVPVPTTSPLAEADADGGTAGTGSDLGTTFPVECSASAGAGQPEAWFYATTMVGTWISCDATSLFGDEDQVGIEFATDGTFYLLERVGTAVPARTTNPAYIGSFNVVNSTVASDSQLVLTFPSRTINASLTGEGLPSRIHIGVGSNVATFVGMPVERPASCDPLPTVAALPSTKDSPSFWALSQGRWAFCNGFGSSLGGIELVAGADTNGSGNGTYYKLYPDASGTMLVRGTGASDVGSLTLFFYDGKTQVNFDDNLPSAGSFFDFYPDVDDLVMTDGDDGSRWVRIQ